MWQNRNRSFSRGGQASNLWTTVEVKRECADGTWMLCSARWTADETSVAIRVATIRTPVTLAHAAKLGV